MLKEVEYHTCRRTLIRVYKLAGKDAYSGVEDPELGGEGWLSDDEVVARSEQFHPAVLLRLLRLMTSIRLAIKGSWQTWQLLYAGIGAQRSWLRSLHEDVRWLAASSALFKDLEDEVPL